MQKKEYTFFLFGDSICFGQLVSSNFTWGTRLHEGLNSRSGRSMPVTIQNCSVNGNTTRQALERMTYDITSHQPDFLMIQFGMNDCNYWETDQGLPRVSKRAFSANLEEMVNRAVATGTKLIFLNTNHPSLGGSFTHLSSMSHARSNAEYNEIIRTTHGELIDGNLPVVLVDIETAWEKRLGAQSDSSLSDLLLPDGIHLSLQGHDLYTDIVIPIIQDSLKDYLQ